MTILLLQRTTPIGIHFLFFFTTLGCILCLLSNKVSLKAYEIALFSILIGLTTDSCCFSVYFSIYY
jgi:hypothetical protein